MITLIKSNGNSKIIELLLYNLKKPKQIIMYTVSYIVYELICLCKPYL